MAPLDPAGRQPQARPRLRGMDRALIGTVLVHEVTGPAGGLGITTLIIAWGLLRYAGRASSREEAVTAVARHAQPSLEVLVAHASRHDSTTQIADRLAERLGEAGFEAVVVDEQGTDLLELARPREFDELRQLPEPREERACFGKWDPGAPAVGFVERMMELAPAGRDALAAGDFRHWPAIDVWADEIAAALLRLEPTTTNRRRA